MGGLRSGGWEGEQQAELRGRPLVRRGPGKEVHEPGLGLFAWTLRWSGAGREEDGERQVGMVMNT